MTDDKKDERTEPQFTFGPWDVGIAGNCNVVRFDGDDITGIAIVPREADRTLIAASPELYVRLADLIKIIDKAGLLNLSNGVQLGQTSWYVKASERLELARKAVAKAEGTQHGYHGNNAVSEASRPAQSEAK